MSLRLPPIRNPFGHRENYTDAARAVGGFFDPRQQVSDAYWALTHPRDRLMGRGRAANGSMAFPLGGRYASRNPNWQMESLHYGDEYLGYHGRPIKRHGPNNRGESNVMRATADPDLDDFDPDAWQEALDEEFWSDTMNDFGDPGFRAYNLRDKNTNEVIGSVSRVRDRKDSAFIPSIYVKDKYRKTPAMLDLMNVATQGGKLKPHGGIINDRLQRVFDRRFNPEREKVLKAVTKVKPKVKNPELTPPVPRRDTVALAIALQQERRRAQGIQPSVRELVESSRARDNAAAARRQAEHARMERNLGMAHRTNWNPARRGGV